MKTRYFVLAVGIVYLLVGIVGFFPALGTERTEPSLRVESHYRNVLGLFPVNILHNFVHLVIGILGVLAFQSIAAAMTFSRGLAILYGVLAVMGLIPGLRTTFDLIPLFSHDIWLHAGTALVAAYFGWVAPRASDTPVDTGAAA